MVYFRNILCWTPGYDCNGRWYISGIPCIECRVMTTLTEGIFQESFVLNTELWLYFQGYISRYFCVECRLITIIFGCISIFTYAESWRWPGQFANVFSTDSCTEFLLTLASERYTFYFDIGRNPGHVCKYYNCNTDMHTLHFARTRMFLWRPSWYLTIPKYIKTLFIQVKSLKGKKNAQNRKQNVSFLMRSCINDVIRYTQVVFCLRERTQF